MHKIWKHFGIEITCTALFCSSAFAADPPVTILNIELANETLYLGDVSDYSKLASDPNPVPFTQPSNRNFGTTIVIADIVLVNGKPAKGTMIEHTRAIRLSPNPTAGVATADITRLASTISISSSSGPMAHLLEAFAPAEPDKETHRRARSRPSPRPTIRFLAGRGLSLVYEVTRVRLPAVMSPGRIKRQSPRIQ